MTGLRFEHYDWAGGRESLLRFGPDGGPVVIATLPLFAEANPTRATLVATLRALAALGIGGMLPDLPGTGESVVATADADLAAMRAAYAALAVGTRRTRPTFGVSLRGGTLIDATAPLDGRWHLAPQSGQDVLRGLSRLRATGAATDTGFAGFTLSDAMLADLSEACVCETDCTDRRRVVRFATDPRPADHTMPGIAPWRRAEPTQDIVLSQQLAADIAGWIASCVA